MGGRYFSTLSLRTKYAAVSGTIILVLSVGLTWWFVRQTDLLLVQRLVERGLSRAEQLASDAASSLRGREAGDLSQVIEKVFVLADVAYVGVFDSEGKVLASKLRAQRLREISPAVLETIRTAAGPTWITDEDLNHQTIYFFVTTMIDPDKSSGERLGAAVLGISSNFLQQEIRELVKSTVPIAIGVLVASCLLVFFLIQRGLRPLADMARLTSRIAQGDFSQRLELRRQDEIGQLAQSFDQMAEALRKRVAETERKTQELHALYTLSNTVNRSFDLDACMQMALRTTMEVLQVDAGRLYVLDEKDNVLRLTAHHGIPEDHLGGIEHYAPGEGVVGKIFAENRPMVFADIETDPNYRALSRGQWARKEEYRFAAGMPITVKDRPVGVIRLYGRAVREFTPQDIELLSNIGSQIGVAIENARLFQETEQRARQQEALNAIAMATSQSLDLKELFEIALDKTVEVTGRVRINIRLKDPLTGKANMVAYRGFTEEEIEELHRRTLHHPMSEQVFASGNPLIVNDTGENRSLALLGQTRSVAWIPIKAGVGVVGVLGISDDQSRPFSPSEVRLLEAIGSVIGVAIENARLFGETKRNLERIRALQEIDMAITSTLDIQTVLEVIADSAVKLMGAQQCAVFELDQRDQRLYMRATRGMQLDLPLMSPMLGQGASGVAALKRQPFFSPDVHNDPLPMFDEIAEEHGKTLRDVFRHHGLRAVLSVPLVSKETAFGALTIFWNAVHSYDEREVHLLNALAQQAAVAIENARLFEETQHHLERIRALQEIDRAITSTLDLRIVLDVLLEKIDLVLPYAAVTIRLFNKESGLLEPVACRNLDEKEWKKEEWKGGRGTPNLAFESKTPVMVGNVQTDPRVRDPEFFRRHGLVSYLGVPLIVQDEALGVISFYTKEEHEFANEEIEFLTTLAGQAAIAIHNSEVYEELAKLANDLSGTNRALSALYAVTAAASQSLDLDRVLQAAIEKMTEMFRFDATQIHIYDERKDELLLRAFFENDPGRFTSVRSFQRGQGIVGKVAESGEPLIFEDVQTDPLYQRLSRTKVSVQLGYHFFAVFPIRGKLKNLGTLACTGVASRKLNAGEIQLLEALADQIAVAIENSGLYEEVREKVQELQQKTAELERANKVKDEFLSVMSHELRTPLNVVMGYSGMIRDGLLGEINPEQEKALEKVINRARDQLTMISSILQATQMEAEEIKVERHEFSLRDFLDDLKSSYSIPLGKELALVWDYPADLPAIHTDGEKLKHVLQNLINNAIKFTEKGSVTVSARIRQQAIGNSENRQEERNLLTPSASRLTPNWVELKVSDTGIGIADEHLSVIFERFRQVDSSETRHYGGVGIGLYIAKQFTELLGGQIEVESEVGRGSTFTVTIPCESGPSAMLQPKNMAANS